MALILCPECNNKISDMTNICIHCGYPVAAMKKVKLSDSTLKIVKEIPIEYVRMIPRVYGKLKEYNIHTIGDLCMISAQDLRSKCKIPRTSINHLSSALAGFGLELPIYSTSGILKEEREWKPVTKYDCTTQKLENVWECDYAFNLHDEYTRDEYETLKMGHLPGDGINFFMYYESGILNIYDSKSGLCLYRILLRDESNQHPVFCYNVDEKLGLDASVYETILKGILRIIINKAAGETSDDSE